MTREEALQAIKVKMDYYESDKRLRCAIETLIPELRESEDERVRKFLVKLAKRCPENSTDFLGDVKKADVLAWLEKQKEPHYTKRNALFDKCVENCDPDVMKEVSDKVDEMLRKEQKPVDLPPGFYFIDLDGNRYYSKEFRYGDMKMKVVEQKSAEWSEDDNIGWDEAFACVTRAEKAAKNEEELQNAVTAEKWLKEIKFKYYVHPVKQELSEEDDWKRKELIQYLEEKGDYRTVWMTWLKSLRPSWKPSAEQMSMLLAVINDPNNAGSESCYLTLKSIYEQLKKLM